MFKSKKVICFIVACIMLIGILPTTGFAAIPRISKNVLDIEAESEDVKILYGKYSYIDEGIYNQGSSDKPKNGEKGEVYFEFRTAEAGDYDIWALVSPLDEKKGIIISINGQPYQQVTFFPIKNEYYYTKIGSVTTQAKEDVSVTFSASPTWFRIDKFTITKAGYKLKNPDGTIAGDMEIVKKYEAQKEASKKYAEKIPVINVSGDGVVLDMDEVGLSEWWSNRDYDNIKAKFVSEGRSEGFDPNIRADMEFDFITDTNGAYYVWAYVNPTSTSKDAWVNIDNGGYLKKGVCSTVAGEWQWVNIGSSASAVSGKPRTFRLIPKNSSYGIAKIAIVKGQNIMPTGFEGKLNKKEVDTKVVYPAPPVYPPKGVHPRVMFTAEDIAQIKENMAYEGNAPALERYKINLASTTDGTLPPIEGSSKENFNGEVLNIIQSRAFEYVINGNVEMGKSAVSSLRNYIDSVVFNYADGESYNRFGEAEYVIGCVYDWCYDLLTTSDKEAFRNAVIEYASNKIGWPPTKLGSVTSHGTEGPLFRDLLAPAIAMYDEYPYIYENVAGRLFSEHVPAKKFLYPSHMGAMQGMKYMSYREKWASYALYLMDAIGVPNVFGPDMENVTQWLMYARLPDGDLFKDGDNNEKAYYAPYCTYSDLQMLLSNYYNNPYMKWEYLRQQVEKVPALQTNQTISCITMFITNKKTDSKSHYTMPLSHYFGSPKGAYIARTSWDEGYNAPTVVAEFKINEVWTSNHQHLDAGAFQIHYKGSLAVDAGYYQALNTPGSGSSAYSSNHWRGYYTRSIAHNTMLVKDPNEPLRSGEGFDVNDGGQEQKNNRQECTTLDILLSEKADMRVGEVLGHEVGTDTYTPNYTYLKGDITNAYTDKVEDYQRSFMFLNLKNEEHPAALLVFDHVVSSNPEFEKSFVLNTVYEPEINGTRLVAKDEREFDAANKYNGKLTMDTLLPAADNVKYQTFVGMDKYSYSNPVDTHAIAPQHSDGNGPRTEVSPKTPSKEDYFLNVIQVGDADGAEALPTTLVEGDTHYGAVVADRVVMFAKGKEKVDGSVSFTVENEGNFEFTVAGLAAGTWNVLCNGTSIGEAKVTEEGTVATFNGTNGAYTLTKVSNDANKQFTNNIPAEWEYIGIRINGRFLYSDVPAFIENGRTLVPLRAIFEGVGAEVSWDAATATATGTKGNVTVQITDGSNIAKVNGKEVTLDVAANTYNGRFMVPVRFIAESLGCKVDWRAEAQIVDIEADVPLFKFKRDKSFENEIDIEVGEYSKNVVDKLNDIENAVDGSVGSYFAIEGKDGQTAWAVFKADKVYSLEKVYIAFKSGEKRVTSFAVDVSEDGVNYTTVIEKADSSGTSAKLEGFDLGGVKGRYIKFRGYGNTVNAWNSITEIVLTEKR